LGDLKIVKFACRRLTAGRGIVWMRVGLWVPVLGVEIEFSFQIFFFAFRCYWYNRRCWLLLKFVDLCEGVINL
jgi:hypothetical protein